MPAASVMGQLRSACRALLLQSAGPAQALTALDRFAEFIPDALATMQDVQISAGDSGTTVEMGARSLP